MANYKSFLVTDTEKEACQATRAISTTWRRGLSSSFHKINFIRVPATVLVV